MRTYWIKGPFTRSVLQPLILLVSIPFAATGAIGPPRLTDTALGVPGPIGMLKERPRQRRGGDRVRPPEAAAAERVPIG